MSKNSSEYLVVSSRVKAVSCQLSAISFMVVLMVFGDIEAAAVLASVLPFGVPQFLFEEDGGSAGGGESSQPAADSRQKARGDDLPPPQPSPKGGSPGEDKKPNPVQSLYDEMDELVAATDGEKEISTTQHSTSKGEEEGISNNQSSISNDEGGDEVPPAEARQDGDGDGDGDQPEFKEGFDPNDLVEVEDQKFFYHPTVHGKDTGQGTTYKNRNDAEVGFMSKTNKLHDLVTKLNESGEGVGAIDLPEWFENPNAPDTLLQAGEIEQVAGLTNAEVRDRVKQADTLITKLSDREKRVSEAQSSQQFSQEFESELETVVDEVNDVFETLDIGDDVFQLDLKNENATQTLKNHLLKARDKKIAAEVKPLVEDYQAYKKDEEARLNDDDYADQLEKKFKAIEKKRGELEKSYNEKLQVVDKIPGLQEKAKKLETKAPSDTEQTKEKTQRILGVLEKLGQEPDVNHPMFESVDPAGVKQFFNFLFSRADQFNGVKTVHDAYRGLKAYEKHIEEVRHKSRLKKLEEDEKADKEKRDKKDMPGYGDQTNLKPKTNSVHDKNTSELDRIAQETDRRTG